MDGTIMDSRPVVTRFFETTAPALGIANTQENIDFFMYASGAAVKKRYHMNPEQWKAFAEELFRSYRENLHLLKLFDGIPEVLSSGRRLGIVTSENRSELIANLARFHIPQNLFETFVCADDTPYEKPHPYPLLHCLEQMGLSPDQAIYVGDSPLDIQCATRAGVAFGLAGWGARDPSQFTGAAHCFSHPREMLALVREHPVSPVCGCAGSRS